MGIVARKPTVTHISSSASRMPAGRFQRTLGDREVVSVSSANFTEKARFERTAMSLKESLGDLLGANALNTGSGRLEKFLKCLSIRLTIDGPQLILKCVLK